MGGERDHEAGKEGEKGQDSVEYALTVKLCGPRSGQTFLLIEHTASLTHTHIPADDKLTSREYVLTVYRV